MRLHCFIIIILICSFWSCESVSDKDQYQPPEISTNEQSGKGQAAMEEESFESMVRKYESEDRSQWQKPDRVIEMMGDLSGKTIADIGAGTGYFSFRFLPKADTVIAIDIDPRMIAFIDSSKQQLPEEFRSRLITRLADPMDPKLKGNEADIVFLANTYIYINDRIEYFRNLKECIKEAGALMILDYKKKQLPLGPPQSIKIPLSQVERELEEAGYEHIYSDDQTLPYQYIAIALTGDENNLPADTPSMK